MTSRATSAKKATPAKTPTKKRTRKPPTGRSGPVETTNLRGRVHPGILASALDLAGGDTRRIEVVSYGSVNVSVN